MAYPVVKNGFSGPQLLWIAKRHPRRCDGGSTAQIEAASLIQAISFFAESHFASAICGHLFQPLQRESNWTVSLPRDGDAQTPVAPLPTRRSLAISEPDGLPGLLMQSGLDPSIPAASRPVGAVMRLQRGR